MGLGNGEMHHQSSSLRLLWRAPLNGVSLSLFRLQLLWDTFVFKWHQIANCEQPLINTLMPWELKRRLRDAKIRKTGVWSLSSFHTSSQRKTSVAALQGRVCIHQYCATEDTVGTVSTAKVTQIIQKGQCGKAESQSLAAQSHTNRLTLAYAGLTALVNIWH